MGLLTMNAEQLRYKMKNLNELLPNRSVANDNELETILSSLDDYVNYHDESLDEDELIGGISVLDRVNSIREKIEDVIVNQYGFETLD